MHNTFSFSPFQVNVHVMISTFLFQSFYFMFVGWPFRLGGEHADQDSLPWCHDPFPSYDGS